MHGATIKRVIGRGMPCKPFCRAGGFMIEPLGFDKYGRTLTRVTVNGEDAGAYLVGLGLARWWR